MSENHKTFFFFYDRKGYFRIGNDVEEKHNSNFVKRQAIVCSSISHLTFLCIIIFFTIYQQTRVLSHSSERLLMIRRGL